MSFQAIYLSMVVCGFALFMLALGYASLTAMPRRRSSKPAADAKTEAPDVPAADKNAA